MCLKNLGYTFVHLTQIWSVENNCRMGANQFWELPRDCPQDPTYCPSIERLWKWNPRAPGGFSAAVWSPAHVDAGRVACLRGPGTNRRPSIQEHAMLTVGFPNPSLICGTDKYSAQWYWEKSLECTKAEPVMVGQGEGKHYKGLDILSYSCLVQGWKLVPLFIRSIFRWWCHCSETHGFLFVHIYFYFDDFCIIAL